MTTQKGRLLRTKTRCISAEASQTRTRTSRRGPRSSSKTRPFSSRPPRCQRGHAGRSGRRFDVRHRASSVRCAQAASCTTSARLYAQRQRRGRSAREAARRHCGAVAPTHAEPRHVPGREKGASEPRERGAGRGARGAGREARSLFAILAVPPRSAGVVRLAPRPEMSCHSRCARCRARARGGSVCVRMGARGTWGR